MTGNIAAVREALDHLDIDDNPATLKQKSRDFFWYSPVLKEKMDHLIGDFVVSPRSEAEVIEVLKTCYAHDVPVTTRGAGTGNYGQAMPLAGGVIMHMKNMTKVKEIHPGRVIVEPGKVVKDLDAETRAHSGQEQRMMPSTYGTATIGGFIAGGSGGIGSVRWGALRDLGNILRLRVVTMEAEPRVLEFTGEDLPASPTPTAPMESSPRSRCRWHRPMTGWSSPSASTISWTMPPSPMNWPAGRHPHQAHAPPSRRRSPSNSSSAFQGHVREDQSILIMLVAPHRWTVSPPSWGARATRT
jgi:hypothetical protein